ncbi:GMP synthase [Blastocystis sp. ATCC 50177/Nand II]|uniref:GMP synthase [glutamine-hydrolyzing] n=1 Tax=Blastocystis sp. subtype 1 (strain ATCC 50177 / NandII) TaxID=478820 RepID=A0A196SC37_BLAHN|nr:GMP synthase [Blastocystis sp. ATCC 50177/Nand II]
MNHDEIVILDFGSQYSHLIARRVREFNVYCELFSCLVDAKVVMEKKNLKGIIFSGGPSSVYEKDAPHVSEELWKFIEEKNIPLLGICYGLQEIAHHYGGVVASCDHREYGHAMVGVVESLSEEERKNAMRLFEGLDNPFQVWMSHGDKLSALPKGFYDIGATKNAEHAAIASHDHVMYGIQFHPEVTHTPQGRILLKNFVRGICQANNDWEMGSFVNEAIEAIRKQVGEDEHVIGAVSGGVDSSVAAVLMNRAIGKRFHAVLVDNGVLRLNEAKEVMERLTAAGIDLHLADASELFLSKLAGVSDPEKKRKIIGGTFIDVFEEEAKKIEKEVGHVDFLLQGTLYPDVIESTSFRGPSATIKSHHNVGGLKENMKLKLVEPLRELFKDEVRALGTELGLPHDCIWRHPFPGPGLAIRVIGAVDKQQLDILRQADKILIDEIRAAGEYEKIGQALCVLLPVRSVGVMGDGRTYEQTCAIRCVQTTDYMTADWYRFPYDLLARISSRIINEVKGINRCVYDISSKPPATIEWE